MEQPASLPLRLLAEWRRSELERANLLRLQLDAIERRWAVGDHANSEPAVLVRLLERGSDG